MSLVSTHCLLRNAATGLAGNSVSQTYPKSLARCMASPSTRLVSRVTLHAFLLPAGRDRPSLSSLVLNIFPPSLDFALLRTPPSKEALRHSGGDNLLWTSAIVTLYLEVEDNRDRRPGVEQKISSANFVLPPPWWFCPNSLLMEKGKLESPLTDCKDRAWVWGWWWGRWWGRSGSGLTWWLLLLVWVTPVTPPWPSWASPAILE